jgi:hypothetical protein
LAAGAMSGRFSGRLGGSGPLASGFLHLDFREHPSRTLVNKGNKKGKGFAQIIGGLHKNVGGTASPTPIACGAT